MHSTNESNAYEGVEARANFSTEEDELRYRDMVLAKTEPQLKFIEEHIGIVPVLLEACCGNGRLLQGLADRVPTLRGFDAAQSRIDFASRWAESLNRPGIELWVDDCLQPSKRVSSLLADIVVCITGAFGYFGALGDTQEANVLRNLVSATRLGGKLLLELYEHRRTIDLCKSSLDGPLRLWQELPDNDPFRFALSTYRFDDQSRVLQHDKIFVRRSDGSVDGGRQEALRIYSESDVLAMLDGHYERVRLYGDWDGRPYGQDANRMIVLAEGALKA